MKRPIVLFTMLLLICGCKTQFQSREIYGNISTGHFGCHIDFGANHGLKVGMELTVFRESGFVGILKVTSVEEVRARGTMILSRSKRRVRDGDIVSSLPYHVLAHKHKLGDLSSLAGGGVE
jgi:hypothetical protein